jgi:ATP-dependent exoDNAse (exonuclease V) beta subunit
MSEWPCEQITFCTVGAFKGLENQFILVVDVDRLDDQERDVNLLYVAMSRARSGLWMAMSKNLESRAEAISRGNLSKVMEDVRRIKD